MSNVLGKKILVIEDERPLAHALDLKLTHEGFEVEIVSNGEEGMSALGKSTFALIVCDLIMPKMDGFAVLEALRKEKNIIPVIILSNLSQPDDKERVLELGAKDFFVKSDISVADVVAHIKKIIV